MANGHSLESLPLAMDAEGKITPEFTLELLQFSSGFEAPLIQMLLAPFKKFMTALFLQGVPETMDQ